MTVENYAREHGLKPDTVRRYIRLGKIKAHRVGRRYEIETHHTIDNNILESLSEQEDRIKQLIQHNKQLNNRNERLSRMLALQVQQNYQIITQVPILRPSFPERIGKLLTKLKTTPTKRKCQSL